MTQITPLSQLRQWLENPSFRAVLLADEEKCDAILTDASEPECQIALELALLEEDERKAAEDLKPAWMRELEAKMAGIEKAPAKKAPAKKVTTKKTPAKKAPTTKTESVTTVKLSIVKPHSVRAFLKGKERGTSAKTVCMERHIDGVLIARTLHGKHEAADFARLTRAELDTLL